jgi:tRNA/rRNA methyltransferase
MTTTRFILVQTSHPGNVGAAARALKVMGFDGDHGRLVLLAPQTPGFARSAEARALASGAQDVLEAAEEWAALDDWPRALGQASQTVALTARGRDFGAPALPLRSLCERLAARVSCASSKDANGPEAHENDGPSASETIVTTAASPAFVFGSERYGLPNELVYRCNWIGHIPANPAYASLNLAQSLMLVAYEWRMALGAAPVPSTPQEPPAPQAELEATLAHWREALVAIGFLDPQAPKKLLPRLARLLHRARPSATELHILRGIARQLLKLAAAAAGGPGGGR